MNIGGAKAALADLERDAMALSAVCDREQMEQFSPFWRAVAQSAGALATSSLDRDEITALVRDVRGAFRYVPGGFMDMYIVRGDPAEQTRENEAFEGLRDRVRSDVTRLDVALDEGELNPLKIRRALVELETEFLEIGAEQDAQQVRALLNSPELDLKRVAALHASLEKRLSAPSSNAANTPRIVTLVERLAESLSPGK